jgi:hypothetical protein
MAPEEVVEMTDVVVVVAILPVKEYRITPKAYAAKKCWQLDCSCTRNKVKVRRHTPQMTFQKSHISHHTSHITHHTSHITHHTSHIITACLTKGAACASSTSSQCPRSDELKSA